MLGRRVRPRASTTIEVDGVPVGVQARARLLPAEQAGAAWSPRPSDTAGPPDRGRARARPSRGCSRSAGSTSTPKGCCCSPTTATLANRIAHPSHGVEKEYLAEVARHASRQAALRGCATASSSTTASPPPAQVSQPTPGVLRITIHEGRNRQVRRMCEAIGHPVQRLVRTRIGPITRPPLGPGRLARAALDEVTAGR